MKRKSARANPSHPKCQRVANARHKSDSEDNTEEVDDISLTKVDIPMIIDAVRSNFSMEDASLQGDSQDNSHLSE